VVDDLIRLWKSSLDLSHDRGMVVTLNMLEGEVFGHAEVMPAAGRRVTPPTQLVISGSYPNLVKTRSTTSSTSRISGCLPIWLTPVRTRM
jgi:hypothetical protein